MIKEFVEAKSGKGNLKDRPVLQEAVEFCEMNGYTLLVAKLDRLSRDVETVAHIIKRINFKVASMPQADKFQLHLYAAIAEQERENKLGATQTAKSIEFMELVKHHFIELIQQGTSTTAIAKILNDNGVLTRLGKLWSQPSVHNFIKRFELRELARNVKCSACSA